METHVTFTAATLDALMQGGTCPRCERCHVVVKSAATFTCAARGCGFSRLMRELGRNGGKARAANQTPAERSALARAAAKARWAKAKAEKPSRVVE